MSAYQELKKELDRTGVISNDFKNLILAWASKACEEARDRGREEGKASLNA